ncbi:unnamed protein product [Phaeothamnion confervicola]
MAEESTRLLRKRPWHVVRQEHKAYFAMVSCLSAPQAPGSGGGGGTESDDQSVAERRRELIARLGIALNIPKYITNAVEPAMAAPRALDRRKGLASIATQLKGQLPDPDVSAPWPGGMELSVGADVDVLDADVWRPATVRRMRGSEVLIHYHGWSSKWDIWVDSAVGGVAPAETHTTAGEWAKRGRPPVAKGP